MKALLLMPPISWKYRVQVTEHERFIDRNLEENGKAWDSLLRKVCELGISQHFA